MDAQGAPRQGLFIVNDSSAPFWQQYGHEDLDRGDWVGPGLTDTRYELRAARAR